DGGLWTRIDWVELSDMDPWQWGFCIAAWDAPTADSAAAVAVARRDTPRTGCNGRPFTRMRRAAGERAEKLCYCQGSRISIPLSPQSPTLRVTRIRLYTEAVASSSPSTAPSGRPPCLAAADNLPHSIAVAPSIGRTRPENCSVTS